MRINGLFRISEGKATAEVDLGLIGGSLCCVIQGRLPELQGTQRMSSAAKTEPERLSKGTQRTLYPTLAVLFLSFLSLSPERPR